MLYQDSRRVINPVFQEEPKIIKQRPVSNTNNLLTWESCKSNTTNNYNTTISDVRPIKKNIRNSSSILGGEKFSKTINARPIYDYNEIIKNQSATQSTKQKSIQNENNNQIISISKVSQINPLKEQCLNQYKQNDILKFNKTECVKRNFNNQKDEQDLRSRINNYPTKSKSPTQKMNSRPSSAINDKNITIFQLQLNDLKDGIQQKDIKDICCNFGYHLVKYDQEYDKINNKTTGQGSIIVRGIYTDQKFENLQRSLSRKGIKTSEQNQKLKDFISNNYLLKKQEHQQSEIKRLFSQDSRLLNNFQKFQNRQKGTFI